MKETCSNFCLAEWMAPEASPLGKVLYAYIFSFWFAENIKTAKSKTDQKRKSEGREAYFSLATLAKRFTGSFFGTQMALYQIERLGYIQVERRPGRRSCYTINREKALESLKGYSDSAKVYRRATAGVLRNLLGTPSETEMSRQCRKIREIAEELHL